MTMAATAREMKSSGRHGGKGAPRSLVSIIIPVFNRLACTKRCIDAIFRNTDCPAYALIIVDNGSTDGTGRFLSGLKGGNITILRQEKNLGYTLACNIGASLVGGEYLLLLNNDTEVQPGWLGPLVAIAEKYPDCGAVGSKLVYPDGRLQEAGSIVFKDGTAWNYGKGFAPDDPAFNFVREVDYCSAASLLVRKRVWDIVGGFDAGYAPAYYEDTDLCFAMRRRGYKTYYQPASVVIHDEGQTAGTDIASGIKRYQCINHVKFASKWAPALGTQFENRKANVVQASARNTRGNILVVDPCLPCFDRASGSLRLFSILEILKDMDFHVTFIARDGAMAACYGPLLNALGVETYTGEGGGMAALSPGNPEQYKPVDFRKLLTNRFFDFAVIDFWREARYYLPIIRKHSPATRIMIDTVDVHFVRELREAELGGASALKRLAEKRMAEEVETYTRADALIVVSEADGAAVREHVPKIPIHVVPNIHALADTPVSYEDGRTLLFVGNFKHLPNIDAVMYFVAEIFPAVRKKLPGVELWIVGNRPPDEITKLASDGVCVTGHVPDMSPFMKHARVSVAPLRYGAGMKGKIGEAMSWGVPVVTTRVGAEGMDLQDGVHALLADSPAPFAEAVVKVYRDRALWEKLSLAGRAIVEDRWGRRAARERLASLFPGPVRKGFNPKPVSETVDPT